MQCKNCGSQIADNARFCENCGAPVAVEAAENAVENAAEAAREVEIEVKTESTAATAPSSIPAGIHANPYEESVSRIAMPMKWHKFLVGFALWFGGVINIINGISMFTGARYDREAGEGAAKIVYRGLPALKTVDVICGVLLIAIGIFGFVTAYRLLYKLKGSPKLLLMLYAAIAVIGIVYLIAAMSILGKASSALGAELDTGSFVLRAIWTAIIYGLMVVLNRIYYKKRAHLFVN